MKAFIVNLRYCAFGLVTFVVKTVFHVLLFRIFSSLTVYYFDHYQMGIAYSVQLYIFVTGSQKIEHLSHKR